MHSSERRRDLRIRIARSVKMLNTLTGKYVAGKTLNVSAGGAMMVFDRTAKLSPGQRVDIGISRDAHDVLLAKNDMMHATVIRSETQADSIKIAVAFNERRTNSAAA
ncbi:PilZ domain-containing protein [Poriferisphaera sp. WC338]|uniref:PilZ domain-containing protein n=1 Tax=Poriferisphaera sp. WC338 TaxID=3425129 RepID=UPI003D81417D